MTTLAAIGGVSGSQNSSNPGSLRLELQEAQRLHRALGQHIQSIINRIVNAFVPGSACPSAQNLAPPSADELLPGPGGPAARAPSPPARTTGGGLARGDSPETKGEPEPPIQIQARVAPPTAGATGGGATYRDGSPETKGEPEPPNWQSRSNAYTKYALRASWRSSREKNTLNPRARGPTRHGGGFGAPQARGRTFGVAGTQKTSGPAREANNPTRIIANADEDKFKIVVGDLHYLGGGEIKYVDGDGNEARGQCDDHHIYSWIRGCFDKGEKIKATFRRGVISGNYWNLMVFGNFTKVLKSSSGGKRGALTHENRKGYKHLPDSFEFALERTSKKSQEWFTLANAGGEGFKIQFRVCHPEGSKRLWASRVTVAPKYPRA